MATAGDTLPMHTEDGNVYLMTVAIRWQRPIVSVLKRARVLPSSGLVIAPVTHTLAIVAAAKCGMCYRCDGQQLAMA
jgi:hypothetical protein